MEEDTGPEDEEALEDVEEWEEDGKSVGVDETDGEIDELSPEVEDGEAALDDFWPSSPPSSSPPSSSPLLTLLKSNVIGPASRCCSICADGSEEFGEATPKAQIRFSIVPPLFGMSKARIGLVSEV